MVLIGWEVVDDWDRVMRSVRIPLLSSCVLIWTYVHTPPNGVNILIIVNYALANLARVTLHFALNFCEQNIQ